MTTEPTRYGTVLKWWRRTLITITALGAALASFVFLRDLALHVGWPEWAAVLLPLSIDALAAAALTEYRLTGSRTAIAVAVLAIVGSAAGNAYSHLYTVGLMEPGWVAVTAVGAVPAVTVGLTVHLFTARGAAWNRNTRPDTAEDAESGSSRSASSSATRRGTAPPVSSAATAATRPTSSTAPPSPKPSTSSSSGRRTDTELVSRILNDGLDTASLDRLASSLSVSKSRATRLRRLAQQQRATLLPHPHLNGQPSSPDPVGARP